MTKEQVLQQECESQQEHLYESTSLHSRFLQLSLVNIFSNIMISLAGLVDSAFLGHLSELQYLAGVALASVIFSFFYRTFKLLRLATTGPTAQAVGKSDRHEILQVLLQNSLIAIIMGLMILLAQSLIREAGFGLLQATPFVKAAGIDYFNARIWGAPAVLINFVLLGWFMGREQGKTILFLSAVGNGSNIILDYFFIVAWGWQSTGAGAATAISQYIMLLVGLLLFSQEGWWALVPGVSRSTLKWDNLKKRLKLSGDLFFARLALMIVGAAFTIVSSTLGLLLLSANTLLMAMLEIAFDFLDGFSFATESLVGNLWGRKALKQLLPILKFSGIVSLSIGLGCATIFIMLPNLLFSFLTDHAEVIEEIHHYILWVLPILVSWSLMLSLQGYFLGLTESETVRNSMFGGIFIGFLPAIVVAWKTHNPQMIWLALLLFSVMRTIILAIKIPVKNQIESL